MRSYLELLLHVRTSPPGCRALAAADPSLVGLAAAPGSQPAAESMHDASNLSLAAYTAAWQSCSVSTVVLSHAVDACRSSQSSGGTWTVWKSAGRLAHPEHRNASSSPSALSSIRCQIVQLWSKFQSVMYLFSCRLAREVKQGQVRQYCMFESELAHSYRPIGLLMFS